MLTIAWIKFTSSAWLMDNFGTVVRGTARPGTRETPASLSIRSVVLTFNIGLLESQFNIIFALLKLMKINAMI